MPKCSAARDLGFPAGCSREATRAGITDDPRDMLCETHATDVARSALFRARKRPHLYGEEFQRLLDTMGTRADAVELAWERKITLSAAERLLRDTYPEVWPDPGTI